MCADAGQRDFRGGAEVYIRAFPGLTGQIRVSEGGGEEPVWAPDGNAVYYRWGEAMWRAELGDPVVRSRLFEGRWSTFAGGPVASYDVHPDGRTFLFAKLPPNQSDSAGSGAAFARIEVVFNWFEELRQRAGG